VETYQHAASTNTQTRLRKIGRVGTHRREELQLVQDEDEDNQLERFCQQWYRKERTEIYRGKMNDPEIYAMTVITG
jgi:hypothetical protein